MSQSRNEREGGRRRAVFLDRDGVVNHMHWDPEYGTVDSPCNTDQFELMEGAAGAIALLKKEGFLAIIVSNQPGIAKGKMTGAILDDITGKMHDELAKQDTVLDAVYYCLHHPEAEVAEYRVICDCRKPKPGLLKKAEEEWNIDLAESYMVGDGTMDMEAGNAAGCHTIFVGPDKCEQCRVFERREMRPEYIVSNLIEAAKLIIKREA